MSPRAAAVLTECVSYLAKVALIAIAFSAGYMTGWL